MAGTIGCEGEDWGGYDPDDCKTFASGMDAAVLLKVGVNPEDVLNGGLTEVDITKLTTLVEDGDAKIITGVMIGIDAATAVTAPTYVACQPETEAVDYDRTGTLKDPKTINANILFWDGADVVKGFKMGGMLIRECKGGRLTYIDAVIRFSGNRVSPEGADLQRIEKTFSWRSPDDPITVPDNDAIWELQPAS